MESLLSAVVLSKGSTWEPLPGLPPYLQAEWNTPWPDGATAYIKFYDTTGATITQIDAASVTPETIVFSATPEEVDIVPAGSNFEVFLVDGSKTFQVRYGKVLRREAEFFDQPASSTVFEALQFVDTFPTTGLKSSWEKITGTPRVYDNSGSSLPNGLAAQNFLTGSACAVRWFEPLNGDGFELNVNLLHQGQGKARVIALADQRLTTYLAVEFEENAHLIHFAIGSDPLTVTYQGSAIANTVADGDNHRIYYNPATDTISVYKGTSTDPLGSLPDVSTLIATGPGYRYPALAFENNALSSGIQVSYWSAKDAA